MSRLAIDGLTVRYPGAAEPAVVDVSLAVAGGERVGVTGPSGSGLSTLAIVAGGLVPRVVRARVDGRATLDELDLTSANVDSVLGRVGVVFSTPANQLSGSKPTVREELAFGLENLGVPRGEMDGRLDAVMARLGIAHLADREPFTLSGGEQQRVAIASIVVMGPGHLVLDEPVAQLDPEGVTAVASLLADLAADGTGILATERAPAFLGSMDRIVTLAARREPPDVVPWRPLRDRPSATVELDEVTYRYPDGFEAVRDVTLRVAPGESVAIVGPNGAGKTTLIRHLVGVLRPTSGTIHIDGQPTAGIPIGTLARTIGIAFQHPDDQLFERTVEREVRFGPRNLGLEPAVTERLVETALAATGLAERRATNPYDLGFSGRKLVALAAVLALDPAVVVLDEPTLGQDPDGVSRISGLVGDLTAAGRSVIAITHDQVFAASAFQRVVPMRDGRLVEP